MVLRIVALAVALVGGTIASTSYAQNTQQASPRIVWGMKTREHVDLWLHGYAMLQKDTTLIPYFRRGYKEEMTVKKNQANVFTQLDVNSENLADKLNSNRNLINGQFLALYFSNLDEMKNAINIFLAADGSPYKASQQNASTVALVANYFPAREDREWLRLFSQSVFDEDAKFYANYWKQTQNERYGVVTVADSLWNLYRPRLQRFMNYTQQANGSIYLSLPLDGEGRSLNGGKTSSVITTNYPNNEDNAIEVIYTIVHELSGSIAASAVDENTTPNEKRNGVADRLQSMAAVRAGAVVLQRLIPELAEGYARFYLKSANKPVGANPLASLETTFPLRPEMGETLNRQLDIVLGGV